jgi:hypothetical protein
MQIAVFSRLVGTSQIKKVAKSYVMRSNGQRGKPKTKYFNGYPDEASDSEKSILTS